MALTSPTADRANDRCHQQPSDDVKTGANNCNGILAASGPVVTTPDMVEAESHAQSAAAQPAVQSSPSFIEQETDRLYSQLFPELSDATQSRQQSDTTAAVESATAATAARLLAEAPVASMAAAAVPAETDHALPRPPSRTAVLATSSANDTATVLAHGHADSVQTSDYFARAGITEYSETDPRLHQHYAYRSAHSDYANHESYYYRYGDDRQAQYGWRRVTDDPLSTRPIASVASVAPVASAASAPSAPSERFGGNSNHGGGGSGNGVTYSGAYTQGPAYTYAQAGRANERWTNDLFDSHSRHGTESRAGAPNQPPSTLRHDLGVVIAAERAAATGTTAHEAGTHHASHHASTQSGSPQPQLSPSQCEGKAIRTRLRKSGYGIATPATPQMNEGCAYMRGEQTEDAWTSQPMCGAAAGRTDMHAVSRRHPATTAAAADQATWTVHEPHIERHDHHHASSFRPPSPLPLMYHPQPVHTPQQTRYQQQQQRQAQAQQQQQAQLPSCLPVPTTAPVTAASTSATSTSTSASTPASPPASAPAPARARARAPARRRSRGEKSHDERWAERYQQLVQYWRRHGHCLVDVTESSTLFHWIKRQRSQYKRKLNGQQSAMTDDRRSKLERLGFVWDSHDAVWEIRYQQLLAFRRQHGHANVPLSYKSNPKLGVWVKGQRKHYWKDMEKGPCGVLESPRRRRYERLESAGFQWKIRALRRRMSGTDETASIASSTSASASPSEGSVSTTSTDRNFPSS